MVKVTQLPLAEELDGNEQIIMSQNQSTVRKNLAAALQSVIPIASRGDKGETGTSNNTYTSVDALAGSPVSNISATLVIDGVRTDYGISDTQGTNGIASTETPGKFWVPQFQRFYDAPAALFTSTEPSRGVGTIWQAGGYIYKEVASDDDGFDETTASNVRLQVLPVSGQMETNAFSGGIGQRTNKAIAAVKRFSIANPFLFRRIDRKIVRINAGVYDFDEQILVSEFAGGYIDARGVVINSFTSPITPVKIVASSNFEAIGLHLNLRNNNVVEEGVLIAGQSSRTELKNISMTVNTTNANHANFRFKQGTVDGFQDDNRDAGNFWCVLERCEVNKLSGGDVGTTQTSVNLQGAQNAIKIINCVFTNFDNGIVIENQNGSMASGITNDVQVIGTSFEQYDGHAILYRSTNPAQQIAGGNAQGNRFERGFGVAKSEFTTNPIVPMQFSGSTAVSDITEYFNDASSTGAAFMSMDASITPSIVEARHISSRGVFFGSIANGFASIKALSKSISNGASIVLQRTNGVIDGAISQRPGGGMDISGGSTGRVRVTGLNGLSTHPTTQSNNIRGTVTLPANATSVNVTINAEDNASYSIFTEASHDTTIWISAKAINQFTINVGTPSPTAQNIRWFFIR